ncbi:zinc-dependent alcohol dehydrogenase family protein [Silvibacterium acidisoli]|uniref:zinc-dependent alcohol dehydrogenase family protein n=1 Tax=Acidobacteriaceae bacterium ZG23-2 TaxID=2883246 RepID=UPI00406CD638
MPKLVRFHEVGGPDVLKIEEVEIPTPSAGQVRIKVKAIGLNRAESMYRTGAYVEEPVFPALLGYEAAGEIEAVGPDITEFKIGDKVSVVPAFSFLDYGLYGELVLAPARAVVKHPETLSWEEAAAVWMQYVTAWGGLIEFAKLGKGDTVVISAASSSVGIAAIQIAKQVGATSIALTRTNTKVAELKAAGADFVVVTDEQDLVKEILAITGGKGAEVVFDPVGGPTFSKLAGATAIDGTMILYGALSPEPTTLSAVEVLGRHLTIRGFQLFEASTDDARLEKAKKFIVEGLASGSLKPVLAKTFPFEAIVNAHHYLESNAQIGKVVVSVN